MWSRPPGSGAWWPAFPSPGTAPLLLCRGEPKSTNYGCADQDEAGAVTRQHQSYEGHRAGGGAAEFAPHEDSPESSDQGGSLTECVGDGGPCYAGCDDIQ